MSKSIDAKVAEWVNVIRIATDYDSPFRGMVELTDIFTLPLDVQRSVFNALEPDVLHRLKKLYGPDANQGDK